MKKNDTKIKIPKELDLRVDEAIYEGLNSRKKSTSLKKISIGVVAFLGIFITLLNTVPVFAKTVYEIDILGDICRFFTFRDYKYEDEMQYIHVQMPEFHYTNDSSLENRVNLEISRVVHEQYNDAKKNALEYYEAFLATGGKKEDFIPIEVNIDYQIHACSSKIVSFVLTKTESFSSAYTSNYYYNIDLETGRDFSLKDILGSDYKEKIEKSIQKEIRTWPQEKKELLFQTENIADFIHENQPFYINPKNQIVVVFEKYEIGVGTLGQVEFIIEE